MSSPSGQALSRWHKKGKHVPFVWRYHQRQGRGYVIQRRLMTAEITPHSNRTVGGLDLAQDEIDEAKRLLEEAHLLVQATQNKVTEAACRVVEAMENQKYNGSESGISRSMNVSEKERLLGGIKKTKDVWKRWYESIEEDERLPGNKDITVQ